MKKVLFIAYNFPPHGGPGVQRSLKFVKYLREFGWEPIVIAGPKSGGVVQDSSLLRQIPENTDIHYLGRFCFNKIIRVASRLKIRLPVMVVSCFLSFPDPAIFWVWRWRRTILRIAVDYGVDAIYTSSSPYSAHLLGLWLKKNTGLPWFADFRDPWSFNHHVPYLPLYRYINRNLELRVLKSADRVANVSDPLVEEQRVLLGHSGGKFITLTNGYDEDEVAVKTGDRISNRKTFTLLYTGSFYTKRRPDVLIAAVRDLIARGVLDKSDIRLIFVGQNVRDVVPDELPFEPISYIPHSDLKVLQQQADALILLIHDAPFTCGTYTGKIFEYIAQNRPILAIVPTDGVAAELIRDTRTGIVVDNSESSIGPAIVKLRNDWLTGNSDWDPDYKRIWSFRRRELTHHLAQELDAIS